MSTVDDIQDDIDRLILSVFEAVRSQEEFIRISSNNAHLTEEGWQQIKSLHNTHVTKIASAYNSVIEHISCLKGVNKTPKEQFDEMAALSEEYLRTKANILKNEEKLRDISSAIDELLIEELKKG